MTMDSERLNALAAQFDDLKSRVDALRGYL